MLETASTFISEDKIREIREACSITAVVSDYVSLKKIGVNYRGLCPFHQEKTPSFFVNEDRKFFTCFGCGEKGDVFTFLMKHEKLSFQEAVRRIAERVGIHLPEKPLSSEQIRKQQERERLFSINESVARLYHELLVHDKRAESARRYLKQRGISRATIEDFSLGFAPQSWDTAVKHLRDKGFSLAHANRLGLIISKGAHHYYDRFRGRIMFPILNVAHQVVGFGGRVTDRGEPKYLNSPESVLYSKRNCLYGLEQAVSHIRKEERALIVEGYLDLIMLHQEGIKNAVAALGTALTEQQISILRRYTPQLVMVFDADPSGEKAMIRSLEPFLSQALAPQLVLLPQGEDPDSYVRRNGAQALRGKIQKAVFLLDFVIEKIIQKHPIATPRGKINVCEELGPLLRKLSDHMERELYIQKVAQRIGVRESQIRSRSGVTALPKEATGGTEHAGAIPAAAPQSAEELIIRHMLTHPEILTIIEDNAVLDEFTNHDLKNLGALIITTYRERRQISIPELLNSIETEDLKKIVAESAVHVDAPGDPLKIVEDCVRTLRLRRNTRQREEVKVRLKRAEAERDENLSLKYQQEFQELHKQKQKILQYKMQLHHI